MHAQNSRNSKVSGATMRDSEVDEGGEDGVGGVGEGDGEGDDRGGAGQTSTVTR